MARARWALGPGSQVGQSRAGAHSATGQRVWLGGFHTQGQIRSLQIVPECEVVVSDPSAHFTLASPPPPSHGGGKWAVQSVVGLAVLHLWPWVNQVVYKAVPETAL